MVIFLTILCLLLVVACLYLLDRLYKLNKSYKEFKLLNTFTNAVPRRQYMSMKKYLEDKKSVFSKKSKYELQEMLNTLFLLVDVSNISSYVSLAYNMSLSKSEKSDSEHKHQAIHYLDELIKTENFNREYFKELVYHIYSIINSSK